MERSNQPPKTECCPDEGQVPEDLWFFNAERRQGCVHRKLHGPQAGVAPSLSNSASKETAAGGDDVASSEPNMAKAATGKALASLPGSQSVAREEGADRNLGDPVNSRRTNHEGQAGRATQRQGEPYEGQLGVGSLHSSSGQTSEWVRLERRERQFSTAGTGNQRGKIDRATLANLPASLKIASWTEEPGAGKPPAGICEGGAGR